MRTDTKNWLEMADYDLGTARDMFDSKRYLYVVFFCHLAVEKALKAIVAERTGRIPPKSHDLVGLARKANLTISSSLTDILSKLTATSLPTRYPEDIQNVLKVYDRDVADSYLKQAREVVKWLGSQLS
ncbi:MAG: HEPN domain-containing protein [Dehalococcoidia bacterium]|nr:HEPN domain-containing protein [Dehalococcoidia bacterium]